MKEVVSKNMVVKFYTLSQEEFEQIITQCAILKDLYAKHADSDSILTHYHNMCDIVMSMGIEDLTDAERVLFVVQHYENFYDIDNGCDPDGYWLISEALKNFTNVQVYSL